MRFYAWFLMMVAGLLVGCSPAPTETESEVMPTSGEAEATQDGHDHDHAEGEHGHDHAEDSADPESSDGASASSPEKIRFVADTKIEVPGMMCPYACWPKVEETLASQPGVKGVQLAEQPEGTPEGEIRERVVELKLGEDFNLDAAIAALKDINYDATVVN